MRRKPGARKATADQVVKDKRLYRLYSEEGLSIRARSPRRRRACRYRSGRVEAGGMNDVWTMDFMSDKLFDDRPQCGIEEGSMTAEETSPKAQVRSAGILGTLAALLTPGAYSRAEANAEGLLLSSRTRNTAIGFADLSGVIYWKGMFASSLEVRANGKSRRVAGLPRRAAKEFHSRAVVGWESWCKQLLSNQGERIRELAEFIGSLKAPKRYIANHMMEAMLQDAEAAAPDLGRR